MAKGSKPGKGIDPKLSDALEDIFWRSQESPDPDAGEEQRTLDGMLQDVGPISKEIGFPEDQVRAALMDIGAKPTPINPSELDPLERRFYALASGSPEHRIKVLVESVDGDGSQMSLYLRRKAKELGYRIVHVGAYDREKNGRTESVVDHDRRQRVRMAPGEDPTFQRLKRRRP